MVSDAILGSMVRQILKDCPEFQVHPILSDSRGVEVSVLYVADLDPVRIKVLMKSLDRLATMHRQHITETDEFLNSPLPSESTNENEVQ